MMTFSGHRRCHHLSLAAVAVLTVLAMAAPAAAQVRTYSDPRNTPSSSDIRSVTYANHELSTLTSVKVRSLPRAGSVLVRVAPPNSDVIYNARVTRSSSGTMTKQLTYVTNTNSTAKACSFSASWSTSTDRVRVRVPHSCLKFGKFLSVHWMKASFSSAGHSDAAYGRNIGRGDSPGCVTPTEFRGVGRGQAMGTVHARLDTAGRFGDGGAGGFSRVYRACRGGTYWIEYNGDTYTVAAKGR